MIRISLHVARRVNTVWLDMYSIRVRHKLRRGTGRPYVWQVHMAGSGQLKQIMLIYIITALNSLAIHQLHSILFDMNKQANHLIDLQQKAALYLELHISSQTTYKEHVYRISTNCTS